jgi:hypothetical protein
MSGISLNLTLRYAIPGIAPGTMIYFDVAGKTPEEKFPNFLRRFFKVIRVTDTFSGKENIWEQTLECVA